MSENTKQIKKYGDRSIFFPLLIIFAGVILLLSNLNLIPGNGWSLISRFWPIIFIFGGIDDLLNRKWTGAVINFGIGAILTMANFGAFAFSTWQIIANFWPIIIVAIGLEILFRGRSLLPSLLGVGIATLLMAGLFLFVLQGPKIQNLNSTPVSFELNKIEKVDLELKPLVGKLLLNSKTSKDQLIQGEIFSSGTEVIRIDSKLTNNVQKITIASSGNVTLPSRNANNGFPWELELNPDIPYFLNIEQIIGSQKLQLSGLELEELNSKLVIGSMEITLPDIENLSGNLECIIGELVIIVPEDLPVRFKIDSGMTGISFSDNFIREGDVIYSKNAKPNLAEQININIPMGSLNIKNP